MPLWDVKVAPTDMSLSVPDQLEVAGKGFDKASELTADAMLQLKKMAATMGTEKEMLEKYATDMASTQVDKVKEAASAAMSQNKEMVKMAEEAQGKALEMYSQMMKSGDLVTGKANESLQQAMVYYEKMKAGGKDVKLDLEGFKKLWEGVDPNAKALLMSSADTKVMARYSELLKAGGIEPGQELETIQSAVKMFESVKAKLGPDGLQLDAKTAEAMWNEVPEDARVKAVAKANEVGTTVDRLYSKTVRILDKALDWIDHTCFPEEDYEEKAARAKAKDSNDDESDTDPKSSVEPDTAVVIKGGVSLEAGGSHAAGWFGLTQRVTAQGEKAIKVQKRVKKRVELINKKVVLRKARWGVFGCMSKLALYSFLGFFGLILVAGLGVALLPVLFVLEIVALLAMLGSGVSLCLPA